LSHYPWNRREDLPLRIANAPRQYLVWQRFQAQVGHAFDAIQNGAIPCAAVKLMIPSESH